jgi:hypothetical protein
MIMLRVKCYRFYLFVAIVILCVYLCDICVFIVYTIAFAFDCLASNLVIFQLEAHFELLPMRKSLTRFYRLFSYLIYCVKE